MNKTVLFVLLLVVIPFSGCCRTDMERVRIERAKDLVAVAHSGIEYFYDQYRKGKISENAARDHSKRLVTSLKYGYQNKLSFWINDYGLKMVAHPYVRSLNGKNLSNFKDKKGWFIFREMLDICNQNGEGHVKYDWQYKGDMHKIVTKIAYIKAFALW